MYDDVTLCIFRPKWPTMARSTTFMTKLSTDVITMGRLLSNNKKRPSKRDNRDLLITMGRLL